MVWLTESYNYTNDDRDGSFVLDLDLHNFNNAPVQVEAGAIDDPRGLAQLAMSLVPARFDEIRPGEGRAVKQLRMEARSFATLRLTGRVDCMSFSPDDTLLPLQVNGEPVMLAFPRADPAHYWPLILREATCPS